MLRKTLSALVVAGALALSGAAAASAEEYPAEVVISAADVTPAPGVPTLLTVGGLEGLTEVQFDITGCTGATFQESGTARVVRTVVDASATATFVGTTPGACTVSVSSDEGVLGSTVLTVTGTTSGGGLPPTGGTVPAAAIWLGVGAVGIGGIAVAAAVARRRATSNR
ncbi:hypothetical protein ABZ477_10485 [Microbacterium sp. NPDC019599]|uniref:hypothetical protein n=1 Tax=Microbacterium sp. NPDC019599 TaxID=3154690 RepID=UPI0033C82629